MPLFVKNHHRKFWGMPELKRRENTHEMTAEWEGFNFKHAGYIYTVVRVNRHKTNPDFDTVVLDYVVEGKDEKKRRTLWSFGGMKACLKEQQQRKVKV